MSAFLGPIHFWLFNKIRIQNELTNTIIEKTAGEGIAAKLDEKYPRLEEGELADFIDEGNIHGWLQQRVSLVENRFAYAAALIAGGDEKKMEEILAAAFEFGKTKQLEPGSTLEEAYRALDGILLNGMPCDHVNIMVEANVEHIIWRQVTDIHADYWIENTADPSMYQKIRGSFIKGIFDGSEIKYEELEDNCFELRR